MLIQQIYRMKVIFDTRSLCEVYKKIKIKPNSKNGILLIKNHMVHNFDTESQDKLFDFATNINKKDFAFEYMKLSDHSFFFF